jgi:hypothetical protein
VTGIFITGVLLVVDKAPPDEVLDEIELISHVLDNIKEANLFLGYPIQDFLMPCDDDDDSDVI